MEQIKTCVDNYPKCNANCCRFLVFQLRKLSPDWKDYYENHKGVICKKYDFGWLLITNTPCKSLKDGKCQIYDKRFDVCKKAYDKKKLDVLFVPNCIYPKTRFSVMLTEEEIRRLME